MSHELMLACSKGAMPACALSGKPVREVVHKASSLSAQGYAYKRMAALLLFKIEGIKIASVCCSCMIMSVWESGCIY